LTALAFTDEVCDDVSGDKGRDAPEGRSGRVNLPPLSGCGANAADLATIELRRIAEVLQIDHASLFLPDPDDLKRPALVASTGVPVEQALPAHARVVARVLATARAQEIHHVRGDPRGARSAVATPLLDGQRAIDALLVVTLRESRRLGRFDAQVIGRASETLVVRVLAPLRRARHPAGSDRFVRDDHSSHR
jgi:hypothetical protein